MCTSDTSGATAGAGAVVDDEELELIHFPSVVAGLGMLGDHCHDETGHGRKLSYPPQTSQHQEQRGHYECNQGAGPQYWKFRQHILHNAGLLDNHQGQGGTRGGVAPVESPPAVAASPAATAVPYPRPTTSQPQLKVLFWNRTDRRVVSNMESLIDVARGISPSIGNAYGRCMQSPCAHTYS